MNLLRLDSGRFPDLFDDRITGIGLTGAGVAKGKKQKRGIDQTCQKTCAGQPAAPGNPCGRYLGFGQGALNPDRIGQTDQACSFGSWRKNQI